MKTWTKKTAAALTAIGIGVASLPTGALLGTSTALITTLAITEVAEAGTIKTQAQLQATIARIEAKYKPQLDALGQEASEIAKDMPSATETTTNIGMERVEMKLHLPELTMRLQTWKLHIPEVTMRERRIVVDVPKYGTPKDKIEDRKQRGAALGAKAERLAQAMKTEIAAATKELTIAQFATALADIDRDIGNAPTPEAKTTLQAIRAQILAERRKALAMIDGTAQ